MYLWYIKIKIIFYLKLLWFLQKDSNTALGEDLYDLALEQYPDPTIAGHLTGMLLELEVNYLRNIISKPSELSAKLEVAYKTLQSTATLSKG